tara:strand:- start:52664 stop:53014 length:351 start_codon:yes stop_codon:yes gene_type:complete
MKKTKLFSLKSKEGFSSVFDKGNFYKANNIGLRFYAGNNKDYFVGYTVSKKNFNRAVDRNLIKRRIKAGVNIEKNSFFDNCLPGNYLFIYLGKEISSSSILFTNIQLVIKKLIQDT